MAVTNHAKREINAKIVAYGAEGSGKGTLLRCIHQRIKPSLCGPLKTMATGGDTLLFFDYIPFESSSLDGYRVCFHLYTLTGPVKNPGTWKMLLKGVDGLLLVNGDTPQTVLSPSLLATLAGTLSSYGRESGSLPAVVLSAAENSPAAPVHLSASGFSSAPVFSGSALRQDGILPALAELSRLVMGSLRPPRDDRQAPAEPEQPPSGNGCGDTVSPSPTAVDTLPLPPPCSLVPGTPATVRIPVTLTTDGISRRYTLSATLLLEVGEER